MKNLQPTHSKLYHLGWLLAVSIGVAGCGPETVGAAATAAKLQAANAEQAKAQGDKLKRDLEAAVKVREAAAAAAEK